MYCEICQEKMVIQRNIDNLFKKETHHICETCYMRYPMFPRSEVIPLNEAIMYHHVLSTINHGQNPMAYMSFLKPYYLLYLTHQKQTAFLYVDTLDDQMYQLLDQMRLGDWFVVSLYENIEEKGEYL